MSDRVDVVARIPERAHEAITHGWALAKALLRDGKAVHISIGEDESDRTTQQNRYYWGPCLSEISEQATVAGRRYTTEAWHELFKRQFLGFEITTVQVAGRKRPTVIRKLRSTTTLTVREMTEYIEKVQAFAVTELGVRFTHRDWRDYADVPRRRENRSPQPAGEPA